MSRADNEDEDVSPAERRLSEHLEVLRADPPIAGPEVIARIVRRARWQIAIRDPLVFVGALSGAIAEGVGLLLSPAVGER
jgi:hypothetical protein